VRKLRRHERAQEPRRQNRHRARRRRPDVGFAINGYRKDLRLMSEAAQRARLNLPLATAAIDIYDAAAGEGWGGQDGSSLVAWRAAKPQP
jgi:3-hydroxyisobutyrate dehydrogenase-like beta-hydroxyacid dehydrogenase